MARAIKPERVHAESRNGKASASREECAGAIEFKRVGTVIRIAEECN